MAAKKLKNPNPYRDEQSPQYSVRRSSGPAGIGQAIRQRAKLQKKADTLGYATLSKKSNSPSASTRERTAKKALAKEFAKPLAPKSVYVLTDERRKKIENKIGKPNKNRNKKIR